MPRTAEVTIDGKPYTLTEPRLRAAEEWRQRFTALLWDDMADLLPQIPNIEINSPADILTLAHQYMPLLLQKVAAVGDLCVQFDPAFENAYQSEIINAFPKVVDLAFPFGALLSLGTALAGASEEPTKPNSPSPSGDAGMTS